MNGVAIAALGSLLLAIPASWGMLYHTSLETPAYTPNQKLVGQDGWTNLAAEDAAVVVSNPSLAHSGRRAIECRGDAKWFRYEWQGYWFLNGAWEQKVTIDTKTNPTIVRVKCDIRLDGPDTGTGPGADLLSATLYGRNGSHRSPFFWVSSNGCAYANSFTDKDEYWYKFETPINIGAYNSYAIDMNYATHMATFIVNGKPVGSLPFGGKDEGFISAALEFTSLDDPKYIDPKKYTLYFDDISVATRPAN